jgi:hypothetical protein
MILIAFLQGVIDPKPYQGNQKQRDCHYKQAPNSTTLNNALQFTSGGMWHPAHRDHPPVKLIGLRVTNCVLRMYVSYSAGNLNDLMNEALVKGRFNLLDGGSTVQEHRDLF